MRYIVSNGLEIRTENAAKPWSQTSRFTEELIANLNPVASAADYGAGKGRYMPSMLESAETLDLIDSDIQLNRRQMIAGEKTSLKLYFKGDNRVRVINKRQFVRQRKKYERVYCLNVLPIIPIPSIRYAVLSRIASALKREGELLLSAQYRNSEFTRMAEQKNARKYEDGILMDSLRGFSFYALLPPAVLTGMLSETGFEIENQTLNEGTAYLLAKRPK